MVLFKINCLIKRERYYQFTSICRRICGQAHHRFDSVEIARAIWELDLPPAKLDIGKPYEYLLDDENIQMQDILF
jgi:hypothetical protein